jgi:ATP-dependent DNA helicase RecQ
VAEAIHHAEGPLDPQALRESADLSQAKLTSALSGLEEVGAVKILPTGEAVAGEAAPDLQRAAEAAARLQQRRHWYELSRVEVMRGYAETRDCRRRYLLTYFGEEGQESCGFCDTCEAGLPEKAGGSPAPFPRKSWVRHAEWGKGLIIDYEGDKVTILFDEAGQKTLAVPYALEHGLLERLG